MAIVLIDNEAFKVTLQIVEDFISGDYDAFIENGPTDDIKLITWEMEIYFKKLEGKKKSIVEYYMNSIYKLIKVYLYQKNSNGQMSYIGHINGNYPYNSLTLDFEKNIPAKTITIKFICSETYKNSSDSRYNLTYLYQIQCIMKTMKDQSYIYNCTHNYYKPNEIEFTNKSIKLDDYTVTWLKNIVKTHYQEILKNIEAYILYCKTEKIDIDFKKIVDRITYIKQYVKDNYDIALV